MKDPVIQRILRLSAPSSLPNSSELALFEASPSRRVALVTHFDATESTMVAVIEDTRNLRKAFDQVVYVTDYADFTILRMHDCIFEFVPPLDQQALFGQHEGWSEFLVQKRAILVAKWMPNSVVSFGPTFDEIIERARTNALNMTARYVNT